MRVVCVALLAVLHCACGGGGGGDSGGDAPPAPAPRQNAAPTISGTPAKAARPGVAYEFAPASSDADGDRLTFTAANLPPWATFDAATGRLAGSPGLSDIGSYADIAIRVSDGQATAALAPFTLDVTTPALTASDIVTEGTITPVDTGDPNRTAYTASGKVQINLGARVLELKESSLRFEFDRAGNLLDVFGEAALPQQVSEHVALDAAVKARVGLYKGSDINSDPDFGVQLRDGTDYLVFFVGVATKVNVRARDGSGAFSNIELRLPASGEILYILDPFDVFFYRFAGTPFGDYGFGESDKGFIPFIPTQSFQALDTFNGHRIEKGAFPLGMKVFDFFTISGLRVIRDPKFSDIDWNDPLNSRIEHKTGINGLAQFDLQVLNVGLFEFDLAATSATLDVGLDRQQLAMQTTIEPDVSWQPDWFPILPETQIVGEWFVNGDGTFSAKLAGGYRSTLPAQALQGELDITPEAVTLTASIDDPDLPLALTIEFANASATAQVRTAKIDVAPAISSAVDASLNSVLGDVEEALAELERAVGDYELALSLNGFRQSIPAIVDAAKVILSQAPDRVRDTAFDGVLAGLRAACFSILVGEICADDILDEVAIANDAADRARTTSVNTIRSYEARLDELKAQARQTSDGPAFRAALKEALLLAASHATLSIPVTYSRTIDFGFPIGSHTITLFSRTFTYQLFNDTMKNNLLVAAEHVDEIDPNYTVMINTRQIFDALPTRELIEQTRQGVRAGTIAVPAFNGGGYTVSGTSITSFVLIGDERVSIGNVNMLQPQELLAAVGNLIKDRFLAPPHP